MARLFAVAVVGQVVAMGLAVMAAHLLALAWASVILTNALAFYAMRLEHLRGLPGGRLPPGRDRPGPA